MMKLNFKKIVKVTILLILVAFFLFLTIFSFKFTGYAYGNWIVNRNNVQDRLYEALGYLSITNQILLFNSIFLLVSILEIIHIFFPPQKKSLLAKVSSKYGFYPTLIFLCLFLLLTFWYIYLWNVIGGIPEVSEVPASLSLRIKNCWISFYSELALIAAIILFISWIKNRKRR